MRLPTHTESIRVHRYGDPDVLQMEKTPLPALGSRDVLIRQGAIGLNYIDVYHRTGLYPASSLPFTPGMEASGIVEAAGEEVELIRVGDRVAYCKGGVGAYCRHRVIHEENVVRIPEGWQDAHAAAFMLKGMTAHFLVKRTFKVDKQTTMLVWAAAGGVGLLLCQWGNHLGARVIGVVGSETKAEMAIANGCRDVILHHREDVAARVRTLTNGLGCNVVYDSVGQATFMTSLDCLMPFGLMVSYGQSSGAIAPFDPSLLAKKGSLFLTRPTLMDYKRDQAEYLISAGDMFTLAAKGGLNLHIGQTYYLHDAATAHRELEAGKTVGSTVLIA